MGGVKMQKYGLSYYKDSANVLDLNIFKKDWGTFKVLRDILCKRTDKIFTDHKSVIICSSSPEYPVWVWVSEDISDSVLENVKVCLRSEFPGYTINSSLFLFSKLAFEDSYITKNMVSYVCDKISDFKPQKNAEGKVVRADMSDLTVVARYLSDFRMETNISESASMDACMSTAKTLIDNGLLYLWKLPDGAIGCITAVSEGSDDNCYRVTSVYTPKEYRRKGYAYNLVWRLTSATLKLGKSMSLYANKDYPPSNACYRKIGYRGVGTVVSWTW